MTLRSVFGSTLATVALLAAVGAESATLSWWSAGAGQLPDSACWARVDNAPLADPVLTAGRLRLSTTAPSEFMYFQQSGAQLEVPGIWTIELGMRVVAESHTAGSARWGTAIGFAAAPGRGNVLFLGSGQVMLWSAFGSAGPVAAIPTADRVHDYRLEIEAGGAVRVYQDGLLVLSGATIAHVGFGPEPYLYFGDGSGEGASVTEWTHVRHDGAAQACGNTVGAPPGASGPTLVFDRPAPNPAIEDATFRFGLPRPGGVDLAIFDGAGRRVRSLVSGAYSGGAHGVRWDLRDDHGGRVPAGIYFAHVQAGGERLVRAIVVTR